MKFSRTGWTVLACAFLLGACQQGESDDDENAGDEPEETAEEEATPVPVETQRPTRGDIFATYSATAAIEAFAEADVIAKVEGEIRRLHVEEGDTVAKNQILASLDGERLQLELSESKARLRKLRREFERNKELRARGLISEGDFERIQYDLEALEASNKLANLELDYTQIKATIDGVVSERYVKLGNTIKIGDPVYRVTSLNPLVAYLFVPEREFRQIKAGQLVHIHVDALPGAVITASVTRVSPIVDPGTGTFKVTIEIRDQQLQDQQTQIKPGMFGRMNIVYDMHRDVLQVPRSAVIDSAGSMSVFVVKDGVGIRKDIRVGFSSDGMVEVTEGLTDSEDVITVGHVGLKNDSKVLIINPTDEGQPTTEGAAAAESVD